MSNNYPSNKPRDVVLSEAKAFVDQYYSEHVEPTFDATDSTKATDGITKTADGVNKATDATKPRAQRWDEIEAEIASTGTYTHTFDELDYGAKLAWRNSNRCIGRLFWKTLKMLDFRAIQTEQEFLDGLYTHLKTAERRSKIRSTISVFPPAGNAQGAPVFRIENYTLLMYAGYQSERSETIIGDPKNVEFTKRCKDLGWNAGGGQQPSQEPGNFDLLPVVYSINGGPAKWHQIPESQVSEVPITHPEHKWFEELRLRWYKLPVISHMTLDIGGIEYPAAPFNGWYMLDEVATRNFGDDHRYNQLPVIADRLGLDRSSPFWKEKALLVLNEAVYHSYGEAGATIVDHHTAVEQFMKFMEMEHGAGREVTGDWSWLIPPTSSSTTAIFHTNIDNRIVLPNFLG